MRMIRYLSVVAFFLVVPTSSFAGNSGINNLIGVVQQQGGQDNDKAKAMNGPSKSTQPNNQSSGASSTSRQQSGKH